MKKKSPIMSLDEAICYRASGKNEPPQKGLLIAGIGLIAAGAIHCFSLTISLWIWVPCLVFSVLAAIRLMWWNWRNERYRRTIEIFNDKYSWEFEKWRMAESLYGNGEDALLAIWECEEVHIPGDCPLCGAQ